MKTFVKVLVLHLGLAGAMAPAPTVVMVGGAATVAVLASAEVAEACQKTDSASVEDCGTLVPDVDYAGGGKEVKTVKATACFTPQTGYDITLKSGVYRFVAAFVYKNERSHERIKDVRGKVSKRGDRVCWTHNVAPGTYMAVWVTCRTPDGQPYEGWVAVKVTKAGTYEMNFRPDWNWHPSWL